MTAVPEDDVSNISQNRLTRYQYLRQLIQHFWSRWSREYLSTLQTRQKWRTNSTHSFNPGTLVIVKDDQLPPLMWLWGHIVDEHPGKDGVTRVVDIRTNNGIIRRPVTKICIIPQEEFEPDIQGGENVPTRRQPPFATGGDTVTVLCGQH